MIFVTGDVVRGDLAAVATAALTEDGHGGARSPARTFRRWALDHAEDFR